MGGSASKRAGDEGLLQPGSPAGYGGASGVPGRGLDESDGAADMRETSRAGMGLNSPRDDAGGTGLSPPLSSASGSAAGAGAGSGPPSASSPTALSSAAHTQQLYQLYEQTNTIPTVFRWEHGGNAVFITGAFNGWSRKVQMHRSGNDFLYIASLPRGRHAYKFIVDDEWRFAPDQPTVADSAGNINNLIDLTQYSAGPAGNNEDSDEAAGRARSDTIPGVPWGQVLPDEDEYSKEPPFLPPHLRNIILNSGGPNPNPTPTATGLLTPADLLTATDPMALQVPLHVTLKRLHCTAIKDGLMVQATTHRYRKKTVASVFYAVMPMSSHSAAQMAAAGLLAIPQAYPGSTPQSSLTSPAPGSGAPPGSLVSPVSPHLGGAAGFHGSSLSSVGADGGILPPPPAAPPAVPASALPLVAASAASVGASATGAVEALAARVAAAQAATVAVQQQQQQQMAMMMQEQQLQQQQQEAGVDGGHHHQQHQMYTS